MMSRKARRATRLELLERLQKTKVDQAAIAYRNQLLALENAREKLQGLENYFEGRSFDPGLANTMVLREASVFQARLLEAVATQQSLCAQLLNQCEHARQFLMQAEQRRSGLAKACDLARKARQVDHFSAEQRLVEDNLMAAYCRSR